MTPNNNTYNYERFNIADGVTDFDVRSNATNLFTKTPTAGYIAIITDQEIRVKLSKDTNDSIYITSSESPFEIKRNGFWISSLENIFITNASGNLANVGILLSNYGDSNKNL